MVKCGNCAAFNYDEARFCVHCGLASLPASSLRRGGQGNLTISQAPAGGLRKRLPAKQARRLPARVPRSSPGSARTTRTCRARTRAGPPSAVAPPWEALAKAVSPVKTVVIGASAAASAVPMAHPVRLYHHSRGHCRRPAAQPRPNGGCASPAAQTAGRPRRSRSAATFIQAAPPGGRRFASQASRRRGATATPPGLNSASRTP